MWLPLVTLCSLLLVLTNPFGDVMLWLLDMQEAIAGVIASNQGAREDVGSLADAVKQQKVRKKKH